MGPRIWSIAVAGSTPFFRVPLLVGAAPGRRPGPTGTLTRRARRVWLRQVFGALLKEARADPRLDVSAQSGNPNRK